MTAVETKLLDILADSFSIEVGELTPDKNFHSDLGADSLDIANANFDILKELGIEIPIEFWTKETTVSDLVNKINEESTRRSDGINPGR